MGAVANLAPEQFAAIVAAVPFVDALTTILDPALPLTVIEWEEWGNPIEDPRCTRYMKSYTPYENVRAAGATQIAAVTTRSMTPGCSTCEPAKWVAAAAGTRRRDGRGPAHHIPHRDGRRARGPVRALRHVAPVGVGDSGTHRPDLSGWVPFRGEPAQRHTAAVCRWAGPAPTAIPARLGGGPAA